MNYSRLISILSIYIGLSFLAGCSSQSPTNTTKDPAKATERVNQANQILVPRIGTIVSTGGDSSALNLSSANSLYREALTYDDDNMDAHFGVALTELLTLFSDPAVSGLRGYTTFVLPLGSVLSPLKGGGYQQIPSLSVADIVNRMKTFVRPSDAVTTMLAKPQVYQPTSYYQSIV